MLRLTENRLKWLMRFYPPLLFQRIWVKEIGKDFRSATIKINRSLWTSNLGSSIFGGTLFAAGDPFYALLIGQIFRDKGYKVSVWLKSAQISYLRPARTTCSYNIVLSEELINELEDTLKKEGKFVKSFTIEILNEQGECYVRMQNEIYLRNLKFNKEETL